MTIQMLPTVGSSPTLAYFKPALSEVHLGRMRFLITDRPNDFSLDSFAKELNRQRAHLLVRVCEPTYATGPLKRCGIDVADWEFADGCPPPPHIIDKWLALIKDYFQTGVPPAAAADKENRVDKAIALHCVSGLGRAPVLVGIALLEAGLGCDDAIQLIRTNRRGALNERQLDFLRSYKPSGQLRKLRYTSSSHGDDKDRKSCLIM